jgi:adenylate cyclase
MRSAGIRVAAHGLPKARGYQYIRGREGADHILGPMHPRHWSGPLLVYHFKRNWLRIALGLAILSLFALHTSHRFEWAFLHRLENLAYDARLLATMPRDRDERIVIVDIDEKSLMSEGRWPWSRDRLATLVDQLFDRYKVDLVGFDVVFVEPEEASGLEVLRELRSAGAGNDPQIEARMMALERTLDHDNTFARALEGRRVVMGYFFSGEEQSGGAPTVGALPPPTLPEGTFRGRRIDFLTAKGYGANLPVLQAAARNGGHFITSPDPDGVVRRIPMLYEHAGNYYASLSLEIARVALGADRVVPGFPPESGFGRYSKIEWLQLGPKRIPVDDSVRTLVPYRGPQGSYPYVSATDVIRGTADASVLENRIVILGTTAKGLLDLRATPVAPDFPGVEVHANLVAGILGAAGAPGIGTQLKENPAYTLGAEFVLLMLCGLVMAVVLPALGPLAATSTTVALLTGIVGVNLAIWQWGNLVFPLAAGLVMVVVLFAFNMSYGYLVEERGKRKLAGQFSQYIPPELVEELSENPEAMAIGSENKEMTVLFSDVRSFTTISESLEPEELSQLMNEYLTPMTEIIFRHRGTIDKYMGDAIMAFWGAPLEDPEHARHALAAASAMLVELGEIQTRFQAKGWPAIRIGVGLNTGSMSVGNMGSEFRRAYTVMGDAVNLGSRLEGLTKNYGVEMIVNETTASAVPEYAYRELDRVKVKGKDRPVTIFEPLGLKDQLTSGMRRELELYREALKLYRSQNWDMAELQFLNLQQARPESLLYGEYLHRIGVFRTDPPPEAWDGVFTHQSK